MNSWLKPPMPRVVGFWLVVAAALGVLPAAPASADDDQDRGSTYARVRYVDGGLTVQSTGQGEVVEAVVNTPVVPGDSAWTEDGRAEIELADGSVLRLDAGTRIDVRNLADLGNRYEKTTLIALRQGGLQIDAPEPSSSDKVIQIDSEGGSVYLLSGGSFRIDAEGSVCTVSSLRGVAELSGDGGSVLVRSGERSSAGRGRNPSDPRPFNTLRQDSFDRFCEERGQAYLRQGTDPALDRVREQSAPEIDPYIGELSTYGDWRVFSDYGYVWRPRYSGAWGPYVNGHWVSTPTGWAWVSYDPWGWAPYHYGRWDFVVDIGWFWIPGRIWSGAWVSYAVGPSYVGWCPLNYYNRPVFTSVRVTNINVGRLDPRGWRFVPADRFAARGERAAVRPDRLPRGTEVTVTGRLPRFDPREVAARPEKWTRVVDQVRGSRTPMPAAGASDPPVPFRNSERRGDDGRSGARNSPRITAPAGPGAASRARPYGNDSRTPGNAPRSRVGASSDEPRDGRSPSPPRERVQRPETRSPAGSDPGASRTPDRGRSMEPRRREDPRRSAPTEAPSGTPQSDRQRTERPGPERPRSAAPAPSPTAPPRERAPDRDNQSARPRGHFVERLFDNVRRDRPYDRSGAPSRAEPPRPQARPEARPQPRPEARPSRQEARPPHQEARPRQAPERPPRGSKHR